MSLKVAMIGPFPERKGVITGGVEGVVHCLAVGLRRVADIELHIVAPSFHRPTRLEERDGITIHWLKMSFPPFLTNWSLFRWRLHKELTSISPDIAHFQGGASWIIGYRKPCVLTIHGIYERDLLYGGGYFLALRRRVIGIVERLGRQHSPHTIVISPYVLDQIGDQVFGQHWHIENPVTHEFFEVEREMAGQRIFFVGRICQRKNVDGLLRAFAEVRKKVPQATLHIAGTAESTEYERACRRFVSENSLSEAVKFLGNINREELLRELGEAACLALVSHQETAPLVVEEAMAAGVPVLASRICGLPYMVAEGRTGYLVERNAEGEIADRLIKLLENAESNRDMGKLCRQVARERFHADVVAEKTLAVYRHILKLPDEPTRISSAS
jgi:glycosyltransferase involved in cell wall biosynthesis